MKPYTYITISKLDTGFLITTGEKLHAISSDDESIEKIRELMGITTYNHPKKTQNKSDEEVNTAVVETPKNTEIKNGQMYGILHPSNDNGKWNVKLQNYMVPELISIPNNKNVKYAETEDGILQVEYKSGRNSGKIYTDWDEINTLLETSPKGSELIRVTPEFKSAQRTAIRQFMIAVRNGLKPGDSIELDPDKDFRPVLNQSSIIEHERGTLKSV